MKTSLRWLVVLVAVTGVACGGNGDGDVLDTDATETPSGDAAASIDGSGGSSGSGGRADATAGGAGGDGAEGGGDAGPADDAGDASDGGSEEDAGAASDAGPDGEDAGSATDAGAGDSSDVADAATDDANATGQRVRIAAANISSGNYQSYDPGDGIRILQGIRADIILMQEMNYGNNSAAKLQELVTEVCGASCAVVRGEAAKGNIPNGVVSRYPILESGKWTDLKVGNRDFVWARIDVPGPTDLWAVSVHLLTSSASNRNAEAASLVARLKEKVPQGDYIVVGGDFNTASRNEAALGTFSALFETGAPYPVDQKGNGSTNSNRSKPYDWVLASPGLHARDVAVEIGTSTYPTGLVVDTRVYTPLDDIAPARSGDSAAAQMQHMAVVRDFLLE